MFRTVYLKELGRLNLLVHNPLQKIVSMFWELISDVRNQIWKILLEIICVTDDCQLVVVHRKLASNLAHSVLSEAREMLDNIQQNISFSFCILPQNIHRVGSSFLL